MACEHKFRTNIDGITLSQGNVGLDGIHSKGALNPYITIIFCEKCGFVAHDSNNSSRSYLVQPDKEKHE